jgi:ClpP class serine protease
MTEEERLYLERTASEVHGNFIAAVETGRGMPRSKVLELADGRVFVGSEGLRLGLVDSLGDVHLAARTVFEVLGSPLPAVGEKGSTPAMVYPDDSLREMRKILGHIESSIAGLFAKSIQMKFLAL